MELVTVGGVIECCKAAVGVYSNYTGKDDAADGLLQQIRIVECVLNQKQGTHVPQNVLADCARRIQRAHDKLDAAKEQGFFRGAISSLLGNSHQAQFRKERAALTESLCALGTLHFSDNEEAHKARISAAMAESDILKEMRMDLRELKNMMKGKASNSPPDSETDTDSDSDFDEEVRRERQEKRQRRQKRVVSFASLYDDLVVYQLDPSSGEINYLVNSQLQGKAELAALFPMQWRTVGCGTYSQMDTILGDRPTICTDLGGSTVGITATKDEDTARRVIKLIKDRNKAFARYALDEEEEAERERLLLRKGRKLLVKPHKAVDGKLREKAAAGKLLLKLAFARQQYKAAKIAKYQREGPQSGWWF